MLNEGSGSLTLGCEDARDGSASWLSPPPDGEGCASPAVITILLDGHFKLRVDRERLELAILGGSFCKRITEDGGQIELRC
jgi:hypothetical protein